jgi:phosphomethylpyrimidine synthase
MRISHDLRGYAAQHGVGVEDAIAVGMTEKAAQFRRTGDTV